MKKIYQFKTPIRLVEAKHGDLVYNQYCHFVGGSLENYGQYCEEEVELFKHFISDGDVVWEIGANTGSQSVALANMVKNGRYIGFEPQIELFKLFTTNLTLNNCENATPINMALGNESAIITLPKINYHATNNFGSISMIGRQNIEEDGFKVVQEKADNLNYLPAPNFIKMDVEGMELDVLKGANKTIHLTRPFMYIENDRIEKSEGLIQYLWDLNYDLYWHLAPYFEANNYFNNTDNIFNANVYSSNMICLPKEKQMNISGLDKIEDKTFHPFKR